MQSGKNTRDRIVEVVKASPDARDLLAVVAKTGTLRFSLPAELELIHWQAAADEKQAKLVAELEEGAEPPLPPVAPERVRFAIMATLNQQQFTEPFTGFELVNGAA